MASPGNPLPGACAALGALALAALAADTPAAPPGGIAWTAPAPAPAPAPGPTRGPGAAPVLPWRGPRQWSNAEQMHLFFVDWFIAIDGMGAGRMGPQRVSVSEGMKLLVPGESLLGGAAARRPQELALKKLELIGIAKHNPPVAFTPTAHRLTPHITLTRPLTEFETQAVERLRAESGVAMTETGGERIVVGPIRARAECVRCHSSYKAGDLLGAFSYRLAPAATPPAAPAP